MSRDRGRGGAVFHGGELGGPTPRTVFLDTHALIWWIEENRRLSERAAAANEEERPPPVSPISLWEMAVLVDRGQVSVRCSGLPGGVIDRATPAAPTVSP